MSFYKKLNKKLISAAVLSAVGAGAAQATSLSQDGTGQVLLYPYYTVRNGTDTLITVVNSTGRAKALKVRFLEGMNSKEVLDFNLYLSKYDVWTAAITRDGSGNPVLDVADKSCTAPLRVSGINGEHQEPFRNALLTEKGQLVAGGPTIVAPGTIDRAKEGYLEIIEMGDIRVTSGTVLTSSTDATKTIGFAAAVTHVAGVPKDCAAVELAWNNGTFPAPATDFDTYTGGLFGAGTLINVAEGTDYSYDPVVITNFASSPLAHSVPGTLTPSLGDSNNTTGYTSLVISSGGTTQTDAWNTGTWAGQTSANSNGSAAAVSAVLMRQSVMNEYVINPAIGAGTDWVVNFPTRRFHISDNIDAKGADSDYLPFRKTFIEDVNGQCEKITVGYYGPEEQSVLTGIDVSPSSSSFYQLCWEVNVITFKSTNVLKSTNKYDLTNIAYNSGWAQIGFALHATNDAGDATITYTGEPAGTVEHYMISAQHNTFIGLPTIGFAVEKYVNGNVAGVLSNYGGNFIHKYQNSY
jgi:hypothetical protein